MKTYLDMKQALMSRAVTENIRDLTDGEIERVFQDCVCNELCIRAAKQLIIDGSLTMEEIEVMRAATLR